MKENPNEMNGTFDNTDMHETSDINLHATSEKTDLHGLLKYMQYMGIVSDMSYHKGTVVEHYDEDRGKPKPAPSTVDEARRHSWRGGLLATRGWATFVLISNVFNMIRMYVVVNLFTAALDTDVFFKLIHIIIYTQSILAGIAIYYASLKPGMLPQYITSWNHYLNKYYPLTVSSVTDICETRKTRLVAKICIFVSLHHLAIFVIGNLTVLIFRFPPAFYQLLTAVIGDSIPVLILTRFTEVLMMAPFTSCLGLYVSICHSLRVEFVKVAEDIQAATDAGIETFWKVLQKTRTKHDELCYLVTTADACFSLFAGFTIICNIVHICLQIYLFLWPPERNWYVQGLPIFAIPVLMIYLYLLIWLGAKLHESVSIIFCIIYITLIHLLYLAFINRNYKVLMSVCVCACLPVCVSVCVSVFTITQNIKDQST